MHSVALVVVSVLLGALTIWNVAAMFAKRRSAIESVLTQLTLLLAAVLVLITETRVSS